MTGGYKWYDNLIKDALYLAKDYEFESGLEESSADIGYEGAVYTEDSSLLLPNANETADNALLYWGWYSDKNYHDTFN